MKKILLFGLGGLLLFILLVAMVFGILTLVEKLEKKEVIPMDNVPNEENNSLLGVLLSEKQAVIDSLAELARTRMEKTEALQQDYDSLGLLIKKQNKTIHDDSLLIAKLQEETKQLTQQQNNRAAAAKKSSEDIKQLAKVYEQMKTREMEPIFAKLDDETIIAIYMNMSTRKRPNVLKALSTVRAARITKQLAK